MSPRLAPALVLTLACLGCAGVEESSSNAVPETLPVFTAGEPTLEIGVVEGDLDYSFQSIRRALRLADGRVAVGDAGGGRIAIYSADGTFERDFGGIGEGPGEFGSLSRIYRLGNDSLLAADQRRLRVSVFDVDGNFARQVEGAALSGDSVYALDVWPYRRFLVDGAMRLEERQRARATLDALSDPYGGSSSRLAWWPGDGSVWIREGWRGESSGTTWLVLDAGGTPLRWVDLPPAFAPHDLEGSEVLGRSVGELDVEFVHAYTLAGTGTERPTPAWLRTPDELPDSLEVDTETLLRDVRSSIKFLASAQEIHYSRNYTYTADLDSLGVADMDLPEGLEVQILSAGTRGWAMIAAHPNARVICTLGYGADTPPGWMGGMVLCGS